MWKSLLVFLSVLAFAPSAIAQNVGQQLTDFLELPTNVQSRLYVPLPAGTWQIISKGARRSTESNVEIQTVYLARSVENKLTGLIRVTFNRETPDHAWKVPKDCTRKNVFFRIPDDSVYLNPKQGFSCLNINHAGMTTGRNASGSAKRAYECVWQNTSAMPRFMIKATYSITDGSQFIQALYFQNPEAEGFPKAADASWRASEWHYDRLPADKKRLAYVQKVKDWALAWKPRVEAGFKGQKLN